MPNLLFPNLSAEDRFPASSRVTEFSELAVMGATGELALPKPMAALTTVQYRTNTELRVNLDLSPMPSYDKDVEKSHPSPVSSNSQCSMLYCPSCGQGIRPIQGAYARVFEQALELQLRHRGTLLQCHSCESHTTVRRGRKHGQRKPGKLPETTGGEKGGNQAGENR